MIIIFISFKIQEGITNYIPSLNQGLAVLTNSIVTITTPHTTTTEKDYIALYIIGKDVAYKDILKRNKKSLKLSLKLLIETGLANSTTDLRNDSTNIL